MVRVVEARNLAVDSSSTNLPYAVIEFDKSDFVAETTSTSIFNILFKLFIQIIVASKF